MFDDPPPCRSLLEAIRCPSNPIGMRMRSAYFLRQAYSRLQAPDGPSSDAQEEVASDQRQQWEDSDSNSILDGLGQQLLNAAHGSLMRHEFAYVLGQIQDPRACSVLETCVGNPDDCVMVRHEAAEALGAIGLARSLEVLRRVRDDPGALPELRETCELSVALLEWKQRQKGNSDGGDVDDPAPPMCACLQTPYSSVDPGPPPSQRHAALSTPVLGQLLLDSQASLMERYQAMFSLRNRGDSEAVRWLCRALLEDETSALLRHEVAYVLGQVQHPESVEALEESLRRTKEHKMVRHESAEALGAIEGRWEEVERILQEFALDADDVVRESCLVALDAADYWGHNEIGAADGDSVPCSSFAEIKADHRSLANSHFNVKDETSTYG